VADPLLYASIPTLAEWRAVGDGRKLRRENKSQVRAAQKSFQREAGTSFGGKPRHVPPQSIQRLNRVRDPHLNTLTTLSSMYNEKNTIRLINPAQRKILKLPPLRNEFLENGEGGSGESESA
jgi:hypothetical protein